MLSIVLTIDALFGLSITLVSEKYLVEQKTYKIQDHLINSFGFDNWKHGQLYSINVQDKIVALVLISLQITFAFTMFVVELSSFRIYGLNFNCYISLMALCYSVSCNYAYCNNGAPR